MPLSVLSGEADVAVAGIARRLGGKRFCFADGRPGRKVGQDQSSDHCQHDDYHCWLA
ncbi:MAG: hypothetical protein IIA40_06515 [SAR324 cluster bacterium]|nr:hypothetical protein [SAR324 cluster bacterium]